MLHRLALRVLPSLTLAVTDEPTRKRKRLVMLVPGLVAFAVYRGVKSILPLSDPAVLLGVSGVISAVTAVCAYRIGRAVPMPVLWRQDGARRVAWMAGWIGFLYGVQLSLLVLGVIKKAQIAEKRRVLLLRVQFQRVISIICLFQAV